MCLRLSPGRRRVCEIDAPVWIFNLLHRAFDTSWMWHRLFIFVGCGIDFLFFFVCVFCVFCLFFLIGFASIEPLRQGGCGVGWSVYFLCFCCLCFYLSVFHIQFCVQ